MFAKIILLYEILLVLLAIEFESFLISLLGMLIPPLSFPPLGEGEAKSKMWILAPTCC